MKGLRYLISLQDKVSNVADRIGGKVRNLVGKLDGLTSVQDKVNTSSGKAARGLDGMSGSLSRFVKVGTLAAGLSIGSTLLSAGQQAIAVGKDFVDAALEYDRVNRVIKFTGANEAANNLTFLNDTIAKFNLPIRETREGFADMSGSFMGTNLAGQGLRDVFEGMSMASTVLGTKTEAIKGSFKALSQMAGKPTLMMEELKGQLADHFPPALMIASKAMGMPIDKFTEMVEKGKVLSQDFLPKFAAELKKTFGDEAVKAAQSPQAMLTRLNNKYTELKENLGLRLLPVVTQVATSLSDSFIKVLPVIDLVIGYFGQMFAKLSPTFSVLGNTLSQVIEPIKNYLQSLFGLWNVVWSIIADVINMIASAVNWGGLLSRWGNSVSLIFQSMSTILGIVWKVLSPIVGLVIKLAGWIVEKLGGLGLKVLEAVAWGFGKIAQGVEWAYNKIVALLEAVGLLDKKSVSVKVQEKVERIGGVNNMATTLGGLNNAGGGATGGTGVTAPAGAKDSANKINEGGSRPVNITIKYDAMNKGGITINTTTLKEGTRDIERMLEEMLLRTLNGATQMATR